MKAARKLSFIFIMRFWLLLFFCGSFLKVVAQESQARPPAGQVEGIVFDKDTKERVSKVNILNTTTGIL
jgi:hypothetical protein